MRLLLVSLAALACFPPGSVFADSAPQWVEVRSPHFVVITDTNEKQARKTAGQFERMRSFFAYALPVSSDASLPITVLALKDRKDMIALEPAAYLQKGSLTLAGLFLRTNDRNYILVRLDDQSDKYPYATIYHEYTHYVVRKAEWLPLWLNEGLAQFYQYTEIHDKDVYLGEPSENEILFLRQNSLIPLPVLFAVDYNSPYYQKEDEGSIFYAESWALTHFLEITDFANKTHRLTDYTRLLAKHEDPVTAAQQAFGDLKKLQQALDAYVSNGDYKMFKLPMTFTADEASYTARPISRAEADAVRADVLAHDDRVPEARKLIETVLAEDPKNALAHETMGSLAWRDGKAEEARKWYGEAIQLDSQSYLAYFNFAMFSMSTGASGDDALIESSLRKAIKIEPTFARSYDALARFYGMHQKNLDEAYLLSMKAIQMEPQELNFRLNAAQIQVERQQVPNAIRILEAAAALPNLTATERVLVDQRVAEMKRFEANSARYEHQPGAQAVGAGQDIASDLEEQGNAIHTSADPVYPKPAADAPHLKSSGVLQNVACSYPAVITMELHPLPGPKTAKPGVKPDAVTKTLKFFSPSFKKITYRTMNFEPKGDLDPCKDLNGFRARVEYLAVDDPNYAGQAVTVELTK